MTWARGRVAHRCRHEQVDPTKFAVSVCTVDGQQFSIGDWDNRFCVQSCSKVVSYAMALEEHGTEAVHHHVGREPSGEPCTIAPSVCRRC